MDEKELQEFDLDALMQEFLDEPSQPESGLARNTGKMPSLSKEPERDDLSELEALLAEPEKETDDLDALLGEPEEEAAPATQEAPSQTGGDELDSELQELQAILDETTGAEPEEAGETASPATLRFDVVTGEKEPSEEGEETAVSEDDTIRMDDIAQLGEDDLSKLISENVEKEAEKPAEEPVIMFNPRTRLRELKKKLVAGPEKRYYELSEIGVGKLQAAILFNVIIVVLCAVTTTMFTMGLVPESRLRFVIFSQVLAMLVSALLGSHQMLDGLGELLRGRFTINTLLTITFAACCVDGILCLQELRIPCCGAFSLEMTMALWGRYERRSTEMAQMDTMRKAVRLNSIVKVDDFYGGKPGILRGLGEVEDFMDTYSKPSAPEVVQSVFAFVSMLACFGISAFAGLSHGASLAIQILATSLLVAVPASAFVAVSRPMAILERRLHMVGTVFCGWKGVRRLSGKAAFPISDEDLFPVGSSKLNGVKFYGDRNPDEVVSYSTSLISAAGGALVPVFQQLRKSRNCMEYPVANFRNYGDGGIGGEVRGEPVLLGSLQFLQDMGVEIPEGTMVNQAVYAAVDGELCAVYAISYAKMRSSSAGLVSLCGSRKLTPVLVGGDFMLTEELIQTKFGVNTRRMAFPPQDVRAALAQIRATPEDTALALATRDDLVGVTYAVSGAKALRTATNLGVWLNIFGGILGMAIMLVLAYLGSVELLTPTNVLLYQLVWMLPSLLVTEWTRVV